MPDETNDPRDVLAAEEFVVPAPDPSLHHDEASDVLAAEEFVVPAPDPHLQEREAHDILAAEEFALPGPEPHALPPAAAPETPARASAVGPLARSIAAGGVALLAAILLRRRSRAA